LDVLEPFAHGLTAAATAPLRAPDSVCPVVQMQDRRGRGTRKHEQENEGVQGDRNRNALPPPSPVVRLRESGRRPVATSAGRHPRPSNADYGLGASLGGTPMTFTPAPRATSIAQITS
jgi:hypothetical protein